MIFMRAMRARNHGNMGTGEGGAENQEIFIRAKVDFMFNRKGEREENFGRFRKEALDQGSDIRFLLRICGAKRILRSE